ncbi:MAG: hypothetical protein Q4D23_03365 [Bacteroidales bacterium]|nr:hypothetical protein [Bacteroidales bacterium]
MQNYARFKSSRRRKTQNYAIFAQNQHVDHLRERLFSQQKAKFTFERIKNIFEVEKIIFEVVQNIFESVARALEAAQFFAFSTTLLFAGWRAAACQIYSPAKLHKNFSGIQQTTERTRCAGIERAPSQWSEGHRHTLPFCATEMTFCPESLPPKGRKQPFVIFFLHSIPLNPK